MAKLPNYNGSIDLISGLRPKNNGTFPLMEAHDVLVADDGTRLDAKLTEIISLVGDSGTLTTAENSALVAKYPQVMVKLNDVYTLLPVAKVDNMYYFQLVEIGEDDQGKYAGTIYVNINSTTRAWEFGEQYNDIPTGNGLPEVTTADAGEVLTVSNQGEWQAQPLPVYDGATEGGTIGGGSGGDAIVDVAELPSYGGYVLLNGEKNIVTADGVIFPINILVAESKESITNPLPFISQTGGEINIYCVAKQAVFDWNDLASFFDGASQAEVESMLGTTFPIKANFIIFENAMVAPFSIFGSLALEMPVVEISNPAEATEQDVLYLICKFDEFNKNVFYRANSEVYYYNEGFNVLGGNSSGIKKQKVSLLELSNLSNAPGIGGTLVSIVVNLSALNNSDFPVLDGLAMIGAGVLQQTAPLLEPTPGTGSVNYFSRGWVSSTKSYLIRLAIGSDGTKLFQFVETDLTTAQKTEKDYVQYLTDEYFDFYIYK